jgi:hypothetical protein
MTVTYRKNHYAEITHGSDDTRPTSPLQRLGFDSAMTVTYRKNHYAEITHGSDDTRPTSPRQRLVFDSKSGIGPFPVGEDRESIGGLASLRTVPGACPRIEHDPAFLPNVSGHVAPLSSSAQIYKNESAHAIRTNRPETRDEVARRKKIVQLRSILLASEKAIH